MVPAIAEVKQAQAETKPPLKTVPDIVDSGAHLKHKRRYCRVEGCQRIVKSQGLCQRHGAKPKTCKVEGCTKQAQGNFDKMCKAHFKAMKRQTTPIPKVVKSDAPPPAQGKSVFDEILPRSISYSVGKGGVMPLIAHLKEGFDSSKPPAWHRNEERAARGLFQVENPAQQLEGWERELVWMEILMLTGVPGASFRHLARAWGRDKGFHMVLAQFICERHGDVERKKRQAEKRNKSEGDGKKPLRLKRRKVNRYGLEAKQPEDIVADAWDASIYGDVDTNEALASEIFDFSEKEFHRVTAKYRDMSNASVGSESASTNSQNVMAQAAMTAILGDKGGNGMQQSLPEAAVALAAMNQIPAPFPSSVAKADDSVEKSNEVKNDPSPLVLQSGHDPNNMSIQGSNMSRSQGYASQTLQHEQIQPDQTPQQAMEVSYNRQGAENVQQGQAQPQLQQITHVTTVYTGNGIETNSVKQETRQSVYAFPQEMQNPGSLGNQDNQPMQMNPISQGILHAVHNDGQYQHSQQTSHISATMPQVQVNVCSHQQPQPQQTVIAQTQQGQQMVTHVQFAHTEHHVSQMGSQQPVGTQFGAQLHERNQQEVPQVHLSPNPGQQQLQVQQQAPGHFKATPQQTQQSLVQEPQHQLTASAHQSHIQQSYPSQVIQTVQQHHQPQQQQDLSQLSANVEAHVTTNQPTTIQHHNDHLLQDGPQQGNQNPPLQYTNNEHVQQQFNEPSLQSPFQHHQAGTGHESIDHKSYQQSRAQPNMVALQHQENAESSQSNLNGHHAVVTQNQHENEQPYHHDLSQQSTTVDVQSPSQQQMQQQIPYNSNPLLQQQQAQSHAPKPGQEPFGSLQVHQTTQQQHALEHRHHRRQYSQPVYLQQGHSRHRRQYSQPASLHDLPSGQRFSFSQLQVTPTQNVQHSFQRLEATPPQTAVHVNDHPIQSQQASQPVWQQQLDGQHQQQPGSNFPTQQQDFSQGVYSQESGVHQQITHHVHEYQDHQQSSAHGVNPNHTSESQQALHNVQPNHSHPSLQNIVLQPQSSVNEAQNSSQPLIHHHQEGLGHDPLEIHHEMHVAQANNEHYHEGNH